MKTIHVSSAIIIKDKKIFITQRKDKNQKDKWEFPGGKIEDGETDSDCIIREIKEELDASIKVITKLNVIEYDYPTFHLIMNNYICELENPHIILKEHEAAKFISVDELDDVDFLDADKLIIKDLKNYLNNK